MHSDNGIDADTSRGWCRRRLTAYKVPRSIHFLPELPNTPVAKLPRAALRAGAS